MHMHDACLAFSPRPLIGDRKQAHSSRLDPDFWERKPVDVSPDLVCRVKKIKKLERDKMK